MSTTYYLLKAPITSIRTSDAGGIHTRITVFVNHANAGTLTLRTDELSEFAKVLADDTEALSQFFGGDRRGMCVTEYCSPPCSDQTLVISESGEITTAGAVRARVAATKIER